MGEQEKKDKPKVCKGDDDYELQQGQEYLHDKTKMIHSLERNLKLIENFEGMKKETIKSPLLKENKNVMDKLSELETKFNSTLTNYQNTYKDYSKELTKDVMMKSDPTNMKNYYGKNIKLEDGSYYYVTKGGFLKPYNIGKNNLWENRKESCQSNPLLINKRVDELNMKIISPMTETQECGYEGKNIEYSNVIGFVNDEAKLQQYNVKGTPCSGTTLKVSQTTYSSFEKDEDIKDVDQCPTSMEMQQNTYSKKLQNINTSLMSLASNMNNQINSLITKEDSLQDDLDKVKHESQSKIANITDMLSKLKNIEKDTKTLEVMEKDAIFDATTYKMRYLTMILGTILMTLFIIYHLRK